MTPGTDTTTSLVQLFNPPGVRASQGSMRVSWNTGAVMPARSVISFMGTEVAPRVRKKAQAILVTPARDEMAAISVRFDDAAGTDGFVPAEFLVCDKAPDFMAGKLHLHTAWCPWGVLPMPRSKRARESPHDDFRRTHDYFRHAHDDCRRPDDDCVMVFVSCMSVPAPSAVGNKASSGGEEDGNGG